MRRPGTAVSCPVALVAPARIAVMGQFCNLRRSGQTLGCRGGQVVDGQPDGWAVAGWAGERRPNNRHGATLYHDPGAPLSRSRTSNGAWHGLPGANSHDLGFATACREPLIARQQI